MTSCLASDQISAGIGEANNFIALVLPVHPEPFIDGPVDLSKLHSYASLSSDARSAETIVASWPYNGMNKSKTPMSSSFKIQYAGG